VTVPLIGIHQNWWRHCVCRLGKSWGSSRYVVENT
jgi:hypothetical protein